MIELLLKDQKDLELAEIIREKGTDRSKFFRGQVDKYTWVNSGSSYLPSDINAACLWAQFENVDEIYNNRMTTWNLYKKGLTDLKNKGLIDLPTIPEGCIHNAHMFYIKVKDLDIRTKFLSYLKENGICAVFHYIPLHSAPAGLKHCRFHGEDKFTTKESERLVRLPLYFGIKHSDVEFIIDKINKFFN